MPKKPDSAGDGDGGSGTPPAAEARYRQLEELLELAIELHGAYVGLTYAQIAERFACSQKTAKRRVKALRNVFGDALVAQRDAVAASLRFRLVAPLVLTSIHFGPEDIEALEAAIQAAMAAGALDLANTLKRTAAKIRALGR
ncbi:MAG: hypothetical protein ACQGVK_24940 [Myxococcota bacterium]